MSENNSKAEISEKVWRAYMTGGAMPDFVHSPWYESKLFRPIIKRLPTDPSCRICYIPFEGIGGTLGRIFWGVERSKMNPHLCNICERAAERFPGGAEVEASLLFVDVRGSTGLAENMSPAEFSQLMSRFYNATTKVLFRNNAMVEKFVGDEVAAFFVPGFAGEEHARAAVGAGEEILRAIGYHDPKGPWIPIGIGIHTGLVYVGAVGAESGVPDISVLGDTANATARITSMAGEGEILISEEAMRAAGLDVEGLESRHLELRGRKEAMDVWVKRIGTDYKV
jgi:adenylate cyclase